MTDDQRDRDPVFALGEQLLEAFGNLEAAIERAGRRPVDGLSAPTPPATPVSGRDGTGSAGSWTDFVDRMAHETPGWDWCVFRTVRNGFEGVAVFRDEAEADRFVAGRNGYGWFEIR